jgi:hypothetical protein
MVCVAVSVCVGVAVVLQLLPMIQTRPFCAQVDPVILFEMCPFYRQFRHSSSSGCTCLLRDLVVSGFKPRALTLSTSLLFVLSETVASRNFCLNLRPFLYYVVCSRSISYRNMRCCSDISVASDK